MFFGRKRSGSSGTAASRQSVASAAAGLAAAESAMEGSPMPEMLGGSEAQLGRDRRGTSYTTHSRERSMSESLVRSGFLMKKGVINQAYKKRWFVLTTKSLLYFDNQPSDEDVPKGVISLMLVSKVDVKGDESRERFNVTTPTRVFRLRAESVAESEAWIAAISGAAEMEKKQSGTRPRRPSLSPLDLLRMEGVMFNADTRIHMPAELSKWEHWTVFDVAAFLGTFNMNINASKFFSAGIDGAKLRTLSTADMDKLGVSKKDQQVILARIAKLPKGEAEA